MVCDPFICKSKNQIAKFAKLSLPVFSQENSQQRIALGHWLMYKVTLTEFNSMFVLVDLPVTRQ